MIEMLATKCDRSIIGATFVPISALAFGGFIGFLSGFGFIHASPRSRFHGGLGLDSLLAPSRRALVSPNDNEVHALVKDQIQMSIREWDLSLTRTVSADIILRTLHNAQTIQQWITYARILALFQPLISESCRRPSRRRLVFWYLPMIWRLIPWGPHGVCWCTLWHALATCTDPLARDLLLTLFERAVNTKRANAWTDELVAGAGEFVYVSSSFIWIYMAHVF